MADAADMTSLQEQLAAHRRTLAVYLRQLANLGANNAPLGIHNGIAEARAQIVHLKAQLRAAGVAVDDDPQDMAMPASSEPRPLQYSDVKALVGFAIDLSDTMQQIITESEAAYKKASMSTTKVRPANLL
jgi:hypothetical protein